MWAFCRRVLAFLIIIHGALSLTEVSVAYFARDVVYDPAAVTMLLACLRYEFLEFALC